MKPKLGIHAKDISLYISCVFYSGQIRTLVIVPIDLKWEKWKLTISAKSLGIFEFFLQKYLLSSPPCFIQLLSKSLNLIC